MKRRALVSVSDKTGIVSFADSLVHEFDFDIVSTGGTAKLLRENSIPVVEVSAITAFPELLEGRIKSMHPKITGGLLADRSNPKHMEEISSHGIDPFHMVVCNLYGFLKTPSIENIDVGGPTMIRSAAKNCESCVVVVDPNDYSVILAHMRTCKDSEIPLAARLEFARKAFELTSQFDQGISYWWPTHVKERLASQK